MPFSRSLCKEVFCRPVSPFVPRSASIAKLRFSLSTALPPCLIRVHSSHHRVCQTLRLLLCRFASDSTSESYPAVFLQVALGKPQRLVARRQLLPHLIRLHLADVIVIVEVHSDLLSQACRTPQVSETAPLLAHVLAPVPALEFSTDQLWSSEATFLAAAAAFLPSSQVASCGTDLSSASHCAATVSASRRRTAFTRLEPLHRMLPRLHVRLGLRSEMLHELHESFLKLRHRRIDSQRPKRDGISALSGRRLCTSPPECGHYVCSARASVSHSTLRHMPSTVAALHRWPSSAAASTPLDHAPALPWGSSRSTSVGYGYFYCYSCFPYFTCDLEAKQCLASTHDHSACRYDKQNSATRVPQTFPHRQPR